MSKNIWWQDAASLVACGRGRIEDMGKSFVFVGEGEERFVCFWDGSTAYNAQARLAQLAERRIRDAWMFRK